MMILIRCDYEKTEGMNLHIGEVLVAGREYTARDDVIGSFGFFTDHEQRLHDIVNETARHA